MDGQSVASLTLPPMPLSLNSIMKIKPILITAASLIILPVVFIGGLITGDLYNVTDILCPPSAEPHILESDFASNEGVIIPKGTVLPVYNCEYMQRIDYEFTLDKSVKLTPYKGELPDHYGYSVLYIKK